VYGSINRIIRQIFQQKQQISDLYHGKAGLLVVDGCGRHNCDAWWMRIPRCAYLKGQLH
jgi:hypothetical protein